MAKLVYSSTKKVRRVTMKTPTEQRIIELRKALGVTSYKELERAQSNFLLRVQMNAIDKGINLSGND